MIICMHQQLTKWQLNTVKPNKQILSINEEDDLTNRIRNGLSVVQSVTTIYVD